jgi:hypothetical protein
MEQAAAVGGDVLVVAGAGAERGAELIVSSTEPLRGPEDLDAPHTSDPAFHAAVVLLEPVVLVGAGPVHDVAAQRRTDRARVGAVPVRGDAVRDQAGGGLRGAEERLGGRHVPVLAEHGVDQVAMAVDRTIEIAPAAPHFQIRLIHERRTVITDEGQQWNVSPGFVAKVAPSGSATCTGVNVITPKLGSGPH